MQQPSEAAQVIISVIPIVGIVMGSVVVFFYLLWNHKEKRLMIERGIYEPLRLDLDTFALLAGLLLGLVGLVLSVLFLAMDGVAYSLLGGLIPLALGAGLLCFHGMRSRFSAK
ncbi:MAG: hypothetical protein JNG85_10175 [Spirochaetaceae bacterium]|nr:hypothetical protein [Spirochaetaceae bacterium]